jgi:DNA polymerase-3 subunit gamma/tau
MQDLEYQTNTKSQSQSQSLARVYRPQSLHELVGQEHVIKALNYAFANNKTHPAYLFTGTRGVGKTTLSRIIAKSLNCEQGISANPCLVCSTCRAISDGSYVDLIEIDAASNTGVDDVRVLIENTAYAPTQGRFKVYVLDEVHMLSKSAFNALLKTLEEPPEFIQFVLATTDPQKIPITILSRCLQFHLKSLTNQQIAHRLKWVLQKQNIEFDDESVKLLAQAGQGSMRDALSLLDQVIAIMAGKPLLGAEVSHFLGMVGEEQILRLLQAIIEKDMKKIHAVAVEMQTINQSFLQATEQIAIAWQNMGLLQHGLDDDTWSETWKEGLATIMNCLSLPQIIQGYKTAVEVRKTMPDAPNSMTGFCMGMMMLIQDIHNIHNINATSLNPSTSIKGITNPIIKSTIEDKISVIQQVPQPIEHQPITKIQQTKPVQKPIQKNQYTEVQIGDTVNNIDNVDNINHTLDIPIKGLQDLIDIASESPMNPIRHMVLEHAQWLKCDQKNGQTIFHIRAKNMPMASMTKKLTERIQVKYPELGIVQFMWQQGEPQGITISQQVKKQENDDYQEKITKATTLPLIEELQQRFHAKVVHVQNLN